MNEWMKVLISLSLSGSMILVLILLLQTFFKERFSKTWQYYILIVVIARLLIPFSTNENLTDMLFRRFDTSMQVAQQQKLENSEAFYNSNEVIANERQKTNPFQTLFYLMKKELLYLWFLIAGLLFVRKVTSYYGYIRYMKAGCKEIYDDLTISIYMDVCKELQIRKPLPIYVNTLSASASLVGFRKRFIILPSIELTEDELYFIFKHELIHHKRNDIFYKWIVQFTACIHWFNPLIYLMIKKHDRLCELSCDESVIKKLNAPNIKDYGDVLLSTIRFSGTFTGNVTSLTLNEDAKLLKERLVSIMDFKEKARSIVAITLLVTGGFILGAVFAGSYSVKEQAVTNFIIDGTRVDISELSDHLKIEVIENETAIESLEDSIDRKRHEYKEGHAFSVTPTPIVIEIPKVEVEILKDILQESIQVEIPKDILQESIQIEIPEQEYSINFR